MIAGDITPDGHGTGFEPARRQIRRFLGANAGLPDDHPAILSDDPVPESREVRVGDALVRTECRTQGSARYFGACIEAGEEFGAPPWALTTVLFEAGGTARFRLRLDAGPRLHPQVVRRQRPWVPTLVHRMAAHPGLRDYGWRLRPTPWIVRHREEVKQFLELVTDPGRTRPVYATGLNPADTDPEAALLDPFDLAYRTLALAHVVVITGPMTYYLTEEVGKHFSVFSNALRTYRPGCLCAGSSDHHPMALADTVSAWRGGASGFMNFLVREAADASLKHQAARASLLPTPLPTSGPTAAALEDAPAGGDEDFADGEAPEGRDEEAVDPAG